MKRRLPDTLIGAGVLASLFILISYASHILVAVWLAMLAFLLGVCGLVLLRAWLHPHRDLQCLACALLTLPVLVYYGVVCAVSVFLTAWLTHLGHQKRLTVPAQTGAANA